MELSTFKHIFPQLKQRPESHFVGWLKKEFASEIPIAAVQISQLNLPLKFHFNIASQDKETCEVIVLKIIDTAGHIGVGEAAPFGILTKDTLPLVMKVLIEFKPVLENQVPTLALSRLEFAQDSLEERSICAQAAVESALLDLYAKQRNTPLAKIYHQYFLSLFKNSKNYGKSSAFPTEPLKFAQTDITLPLLPLDQIKSFMEFAEALKVPYYKLKVGENNDENLERIVTFARYNTRNVPFSLDGNQGLTFETALQLIERLGQHSLYATFLEQPLPEGDVVGLESLAKTIKIPICADESVFSKESAQSLISRGFIKMFNLKVMKSGLLETIEIAKLGIENDITLMIGGMMETEIGMTHSLHLCAGIAAISHVDLDTPFFLKNPISIAGPFSNKSSTLYVPAEDGIGLNLDF